MFTLLISDFVNHNEIISRSKYTESRIKNYREISLEKSQWTRRFDAINYLSQLDTIRFHCKSSNHKKSEETTHPDESSRESLQNEISILHRDLASWQFTKSDHVYQCVHSRLTAVPSKNDGREDTNVPEKSRRDSLTLL